MSFCSCRAIAKVYLEAASLFKQHKIDFDITYLDLGTQEIKTKHSDHSLFLRISRIGSALALH